MSSAYISCDELTDGSTFSHSLVTCDGTILFEAGERVEEAHLRLLRSVGIRGLYRVEGATEASMVRARHNTACVDILDVLPGQRLAKPAVTPRGVLALQAGAALTPECARRLARFGVHKVTVHLDDLRRPETDRFLAGKERIADQQKTVVKRRETADLPLDIVEFFTSNWVDLTRKFAQLEFTCEPSDLRRGMAYGGDFAWMLSVHGDVNLICMITLERPCAEVVTCRALRLARTQLTDSVTQTLTSKLTEMCIQDVDRMCSRSGRSARVAQAMPMWDARLELPTVSWSLTMQLTSSAGWTRLVFGLIPPDELWTAIPVTAGHVGGAHAEGTLPRTLQECCPTGD